MLQTKFVGLDELGGPAYSVLASFRATILYPYDVALAIFYELYQMSMPLLMPHRRLLPFFVYRGLHSHKDYHHVRPDPSGIPNRSFPGAGIGSPPFVPALEEKRWFFAGGAWSGQTDFATFPHILRFGTVAELMSFLVPDGPGAIDWSEVSAKMRSFNEESLAQSSARWASGVAAVLLDRGGASHNLKFQAK
eukprot:TRINITY_DN19286_c0_g1_i2.p1 TRINITY_DN19286_c0_g1~~TRINITY_DN19286_c0_g1_i2.p1  ORF type:complete len:192 (+),score=36.83 TRINITY_DN19286_c0_g1_i2:126-701(+)